VITTNPSMDFSRRLYGGLLNLYPRDFLDEFGASMLQLFTDQCRCALRENGTRGMVFLWLRTISDLVVSLLREHLVSSRASLGLLEAVPNKPLPWKGVVLVMIPGLVFFIGQIGQLAGEDWFFLLVRRAAYYLIVPVLLVWFVKRKFPIWGLIPLGMLYRTLFDVGYRVESMLADNIRKIFESPASPIVQIYSKVPAVMKAMSDTLKFLTAYELQRNILISAAFIAAAVLMAVLIARRTGFPRAARAWTGVFLLLTLTEMMTGVFSYLIEYKWTVTDLIHSTTYPTAVAYIARNAYYYFTLYFGFLLLILIGAFLARRHGRLALLLPLGYLIPAVVFGKFDYDPFGVPNLLVFLSLIVFTYRILVTLVAPVWIVRSATEYAQKRAGTIGLLAAIGILLAGNIGFVVTGIIAIGWSIQALNIYYSISPELIMLAGAGIAIALYKPVASPQAVAGLAAVGSKI
jgi:hypothetical protein